MTTDADLTGVRAITATSVVDEVTREIRRSILSGALKPGTGFSLRKLAGELGVSFIPVREALRRLEGQGLVVAEHGRSARVAPLSSEDLHGIYRLRRQIEPEIASRSCLLLTDEDCDRLESSVELFGDESMGIDEVYDAHHEFHLDLLRPAATGWDIVTLETLWRAAERYIRLAFSQLDDVPAEHSRRGHAHEDLLNAFRTRDPRKVARAVRRHLNDNEALAQHALT
jgi:DNA-binding GntR family transcriptional regulator